VLSCQAVSILDQSLELVVLSESDDLQHGAEFRENLGGGDGTVRGEVNSQHIFIETVLQDKPWGLMCISFIRTLGKRETFLLVAICNLTARSRQILHTGHFKITNRKKKGWQVYNVKQRGN